MGHPVSEFAIIGQQDEARGLSVETTDVKQTDTARHSFEVGQARAAFRIVHSRDNSLRLIKYVVDVTPRSRDTGPIDPDLIALRVNTSPLLNDEFTIDLNPSGRDHVFSSTAGCQTGLGQHLLQPDALLVTHMCP